MTDPDWAQVLRVLYTEEEPLYRKIEGELSETHELVEHSNLDVDRVEDALLFLREQGLVEQNGAGYEKVDTGHLQSTHIEYQLTEKGFDVAHERELRKQQHRLTESQNDATDTLADFTVILGVTALVQALAAVVSADRYSLVLAVIYASLLALLWYKADDWLRGA